jgi:hypothetical protein
MIAFERRASVILYRLLQGHRSVGPFLLPANVCDVVPATFRAVGRAYRLVDIEPRGLGIDKEACLAAVATASIAGLVFVHPFGAEDSAVPGFFAALRERQTDLLLIDDRCLCPPASDPILVSGADATLYSTGYGKYLDLGGGGLGAIADGAPYTAVEPSTLTLDRPVETAHGASRADSCLLDLAPPATTREEHRSRIRAALPATTAHKRRLNAIYRSAIAAEHTLPDPSQQWRFNVLVEEPTALLASLFAAGLFASRHYPPLAMPERYPVAAQLAGRIVNLFNDHHYDETMAARTAEIVARHLARRASGR